MQCRWAKATKWMAVSAWGNDVSLERNDVTAWRYGVSACVTALQTWRDDVTAWRNGVSLTCDDVTDRRNSVSVTCNDVTAKRTDTISRREHVSLVVGFRCLDLRLGSSIRVRE